MPKPLNSGAANVRKGGPPETGMSATAPPAVSSSLPPPAPDPDLSAETAQPARTTGPAERLVAPEHRARGTAYGRVRRYTADEIAALLARCWEGINPAMLWDVHTHLAGLVDHLYLFGPQPRRNQAGLAGLVLAPRWDDVLAHALPSLDSHAA